MRYQQQDKRMAEDAKLTNELKKRHDLMRKRVEKTMKEKSENVTQLKSLFALFTQQRKALEVSIQKTKRLEDENQKLDARNKLLEEQAKSHSRKVESIEQEKDSLAHKYRREKDLIEQELDEKRNLVKKYESEYKEWSG